MAEVDAVRARADHAGPVTRASLAGDLRALGLAQGDTVLVHTSMSALGWVCGGSVTVVDALLEVLGPAGTLVMPTFTSDLSEPSYWRNPPVPQSWWPVIRQEMPAFEPALTPGRYLGAVSETLRTWPGAVRGPHPQMSFAALGPRAAEIVAPHSVGVDLGEGSPLARLYDMGAQVLLLGVGHANNSSLHLAENRASWPGKTTIEQGSAVRVSGLRRWVTWQTLDDDTGDFPEVGEVVDAASIVTIGLVGSAESRLMPVRELVDVATVEITRRRSLPPPAPAPPAPAATIAPLRTEQRDAARAVFNHWITTSTATFHETALSAEEFALEVADQPDHRHGCFGISVGGALAGYVVIAPFKGRCAYRNTAEVSVYLAAQHTGQGLGRQAVEYAIAHARTAGLHLLLAVICTENEGSMALFRSAGFDETGRLREVGRKFGRLLDVAYLQRVLD
ncbi:MAG TPA: GNAT family N-acetyltransferase [Mycobacteriales bacterium]|nr:GNAT family N-acetyltransferase [Mycobacteriales bacterium]